ncbi:CehA/McbA family metallohydrolase domain-containing protein [Oceanisphaera avium]|uniref:Uncharacterized protein n=1 Tax=Oceanisphaera avium TaxID=1903694 RepID=A0A1Y0D070_9GAMM|nr:hypothetical protein [Oceanisphaera avium]ART80963.1 hypothetical protein CBP12_13020 [Oceanisphaera avium]
MRFYKTGLTLLAAMALTACSSKSNDIASKIDVSHGPTHIVDGNAKGADDITVTTPYFAFALSQGALVDLAMVKEGAYTKDLVKSVDFVPGSGDFKYQNTKIVKQTADELVIEVTRSWNNQEVVSRYEVSKDYPGVKLTTTLPDAVDDPLFAGYQLERNQAIDNSDVANYNDMTRMVRNHWSSAQLQNNLNTLYETDDLRRSYSGKNREFSAWLSAGSLGSLESEQQFYTSSSPQAELGLFDLKPIDGNFENYLSVMRQRWDRGERVYLNAGPLLKNAKQHSGKVYAYTPKGRITADFARAAARGHSFVSFGPEVYPLTTNFGGEAEPFSKTEVEFRSDLGLAKAEIWLDGVQVAGWKINGAKLFRTGVPVPPNRTWMQWIVEDVQGNKAYSNPIWVK